MGDKTTIGKLRLGKRIVFGRYTAAWNGEPQDITWIKASTESDFVSEFVLDKLIYDKPERREGERYARSYNEYGLSNIHTYLNSVDKIWYRPTHQFDAPPDYQNHVGFLHYFDPEELDCLIERTLEDGTVAMMTLPSENEVFGGVFQYFKKGAKRAHASSDARRVVLHYLQDYQWSDVGLRTPSPEWRGSFCIVDTGGFEYQTSAGSRVGIRPTCRIDPATTVEQIDENTYEILQANDEMFSMGCLDLKSMLGLV